jgi:hypothetical protein
LRRKDLVGSVTRAKRKKKKKKKRVQLEGSCSEAGSYLRLIDSCITQPKAQGPSRIYNKSGEEEEADRFLPFPKLKGC